MKNRWMTILLIFSLTVNVAAVVTLAYFWHHNRVAPLPPPGLDAQPLQRHLPAWQDVDLPPKTRRELAHLRRQFRSQVFDLRKELDQSRLQLMQQLMRPNIDKDSLNASLQKLTAMQMEMEKMTINHLLEIRSHLTNDQWQQLLQSMERERRFLQRAPLGRKGRPFTTPE